MELYIHIPFCKSKCIYCDFLSAPTDEKSQLDYVEKLCEEIKNTDGFGKEVTSVFFGGGTPSILPLGTVKKILDTIYSKFEVDANAEISIECNPGTVTIEKLSEYKKAGINRISFGLQSANNQELKWLGRIHTYEEFLESYNMARDAGFDNINIDLMSGLINQSVEDFRDTLLKVVALNPEHISAYSLIIEDGTPLFDYVEKCEKEGRDVRLSEDTDREIYKETKKILEKAGYKRYEISNYAKKGFECKHNLGYWQGENYIGFGLGASSYINQKDVGNSDELFAIRYKNTDSLEEYNQKLYINKIITEELDKKDLMSEFMITGLRVCDGVSKSMFYQKFSENIMDIFGDIIENYKNKGMMEEVEDRIRLTDQGIDVSNYILCDFL